MKNTEFKKTDDPAWKEEKKKYKRPKILSVEPLEIVAAACDSPFKTVAQACTVGLYS